jgi:hypothetical protein
MGDASMSMIILSAALQASASEGLSWGTVVDAFPTDPLSLVTLLLVVVSVGIVVYFGTRPGTPPTPGEAEDTLNRGDGTPPASGRGRRAA